MALDQSALSELLDALRAGGDLTASAKRPAYPPGADRGRGRPADRRRAAMSAPRPHHPPQRHPLAVVVDQGRRCRAADPQAAGGLVLPGAAGARRRIDRALLAVVMEAYVHGTSHPQGRRPGQGPGRRRRHLQVRGLPDLCRAGWRGGRVPLPLAGPTGFPYLFLDATYLKARVDGRVVSRAVVIATGVTADGGREVLGLDVGDSEDGAFWTAFLRSLKARGLAGVQLVISDAHTGLKAIRRGHGRRGLAALPGPLPAQRARPGPQGLGRDGRRRHPHHLRPARRRRGHDQLDKVAAMLGPSSPARGACWPTPRRT